MEQASVPGLDEVTAASCAAGRGESPLWALISCLAVIAMLLGLAALRYSAPAPVASDAPVTSFSAARAFGVLQAVATQPRPTGSAANAQARALLLRSLAALGWQAQTQRTFACGAEGICGFVENIVATLEGTAPDAAWVALAAHYDSVAASPGAGDDGLGVASLLEAARALSAGPRPLRTVCLLITDGEEDGLVGAEAFVGQHPLARRIGSVLNVDARGNGGPSLLFESSDSNLVIPEAARSLSHPNASSLHYEVYRRLPNRTDFALLRKLGKGASFANVGGLPAYHSASDTPARIQLGTLQHHGDQLLALARAFAAEPVHTRAPVAPQPVVWFDVFGFFVARWPQAWCEPVAGAALVLLVLLALLRGRGARGLLSVALALLAALAGGALAGLALGAVGALPTEWIAQPTAACLAVHAAAVACGTGTLWLLARLFGIGAASLTTGTWLCMAALAYASARVAPGASYLFLVPVLVALVCAWLPLRAPGVTHVPALVAAAVVWSPLSVQLYDSLGCGPVLAVPTALFTVSLLALLLPVRRAVTLAALSVWFAASAVACFRPPFSPDSPQRVNVAHQQGEHGAAAAIVEGAWGPLPGGPLPQAMLAALGPTDARRSVSVFPGTPPGSAASDGRIDLPGPELQLLETREDDTQRVLRVKLRSPRGAPTLLLQLPDDPLLSLSAQGVEMPHRIAFMQRSVAFRAVPAEGIEIELRSPQRGKAALALYDVSSGLPQNSLAARVAAQRPRSAAPYQEGDLTVLVKRAEL